MLLLEVVLRPVSLTSHNEQIDAIQFEKHERRRLVLSMKSLFSESRTYPAALALQGSDTKIQKLTAERTETTGPAVVTGYLDLQTFKFRESLKVVSQMLSCWKTQLIAGL